MLGLNIWITFTIERIPQRLKKKKKVSFLHLFNITSLRIQSILGQTKKRALNCLVMYCGLFKLVKT